MFGSGSKFDITKDIPDLSSKTVLVTGGNSGLGKETVRILAKHNAGAIFMASRSQAKAEAAIADIKRESPSANIHFLELDLTDFASVSAAAKSFTLTSDGLDILVNNAGIMNGPYSETAQGYEIQFGTNHMGHALLTHLLMPTLLRTAEESDSDVRIVNLSSSAIGMAHLNWGIVTDHARLSHMYTALRYGNSKLANLLHARALAERFPQLTVTSVHPGFVATELFNATSGKKGGATWLEGLFRWAQGWYTPVDNGARNQLWAMLGLKEEVRMGYYFTPVGCRDAGGLVGTKAGADKLWSYTMRELERQGYGETI